MIETDLSKEQLAPGTLASRWSVAALGVALQGAVGSVYLSIGLGLKTCPLCFYQRSFRMAAAIVLIASLWLDGLRSIRACIVALPLAWSGLGVAAFHEYLVLVGKLECPPALFGWGAGPIQSLAVFGIGWLIVLVSTFLINHFDLFGLRQVWLFFNGRLYSHIPFHTPWLYRVVGFVPRRNNDKG